MITDLQKSGVSCSNADNEEMLPEYGGLEYKHGLVQTNRCWSLDLIISRKIYH